MGDRKCGYCRMYGHTVPNCQMKNGQRELVRRFVGQQRRDIADLLIANGWGIGAIVEGDSYEVEGPVTGIITQETLDEAMHAAYIDYNSVKYSKQVSIRLKSYSGRVETVPSELGNYIYHGLQNAITLAPYNVDGHPMRCNVHMSDLQLGPNWNSHRKPETKGNWGWMKWGSLLCPSEDGYPSKEALDRRFHIHSRLSKDDSTFETPIAP